MEMVQMGAGEGAEGAVEVLLRSGADVATVVEAAAGRGGGRNIYI